MNWQWSFTESNVRIDEWYQRVLCVTHLQQVIYSFPLFIFLPRMYVCMCACVEESKLYQNPHSISLTSFFGTLCVIARVVCVFSFCHDFFTWYIYIYIYVFDLAQVRQLCNHNKRNKQVDFPSDHRVNLKNDL